MPEETDAIPFLSIELEDFEHEIGGSGGPEGELAMGAGLDKLEPGLLKEVRGESTNAAWTRDWHPSTLLSPQTLAGSMNLPLLAYAIGLIKNRKNAPELKRLKMLEWLPQYLSASRQHLGLRESPHSRIYFTWTFLSVVTVWAVLTKEKLVPDKVLEDVRQWCRSSLALLALVAIERPARIGKWLHVFAQKDWHGYGVAACGGRSFSFSKRTDIPKMFHHLEMWGGDHILKWLLGGPDSDLPRPAGNWEKNILLGLKQRWANPQNLLTSQEKSQLKKLIEKGEGVEEVLKYVEPFLPGQTFTSMRFKSGVVNIMHSSRQVNLHTAPVYGVKLHKDRRQIEVLVVDSGSRKSPGNPTAVMHGQAEIKFEGNRPVRATARREGGSSAAPQGLDSMNLTDLGELIYGVRLGPKGIKLFSKESPPPKDETEPKQPPPDDTGPGPVPVPDDEAPEPDEADELPPELSKFGKRLTAELERQENGIRRMKRILFRIHRRDPQALPPLFRGVEGVFGRGDLRRLIRSGLVDKAESREFLNTVLAKLERGASED